MKIYSAMIPVMSSCLYGFTSLFMFDLATIHQTRLREDFIVPVDLEIPALVDGRLEEVEQIARIHLAGVVAQMRGQVDRSDALHALVLDDLAGPCELAVATLLSRNIHNHRAGPHPLDHGPRNELGSRPPRDGCSCDHCVRRGNARVQNFLVFGLFLSRQLARVAADAIRADTRIDELRAKGLHLLLGGASDVIRFDDRAEATGSGDGVKSGDAGANNQYGRRPNGAGSSREHWHEFGQIIGCYQNGLVAGDGGL